MVTKIMLLNSPRQRRYAFFVGVLILQIVFLFALWFFAARPHRLALPSLNHKLECVSYTPFRGAENPFDLGNGLKISSERFDKDMALLSQYFSCVRVYSATGLDALMPILDKYD